MLLKVPTISGPLRPLVLSGCAALLCGACAQNNLEMPLANLSDPAPAAAPAAVGDVAATPLNPITTASVPDIEVSPQVASTIRQARTLRQSGQKAEALELLDKSAGANKDVALIGERGLLALELGQIVKAEQLLARAQDPKRPDWRLQSGYGAALSANGKQKEAQAQFAKALAHAPDQTAVLNNLALSYALEGRRDEAEKILRQAISRTGDPKAKQNLALILGLNGKVNEARALAESTLPPDNAKANIAYFERVGNGKAQISRADTVAAQPIRAASVAEDKPIMQLGVPD